MKRGDVECSDEADDAARCYHEEVLCAMKVYASGAVEIAPGLSEEEPEEGRAVRGVGCGSGGGGGGGRDR